MAARILPLARDREVYVHFKHEDEPTGALNAAAFLEAAVRLDRAGLDRAGLDEAGR